MNSKTLYRSAFVALCLISMLVLPAAAAQNGQASDMRGNAIDQGLKDELWADHQQYRLQRFDMNVEQATGVLSILDKYGIDAASCRTTVAAITGKRSALESALSTHEQEKLRTVNEEVKTLWKQFRKDIRSALREHYGGRAAGTSLPGLTGADDPADMSS